MEQQIKKGKFLALLRNGKYDVYHNDKFLFTISAHSALLIVKSDILNEISKQFRDERDNNKR